MIPPRRFRPRAIPLGLVAGALVAAAVGVAVETPAQSQYMSVDEVKPGMKGHGMTVFQGTKPERFEVEVISTLRNFRPGQDLFLVKTNHPRLEVARTVAGMSGSPIYIDGKLIGAYAYGWFFNVEPIAGVTPIHNMLDDLKRPVPKELLPGLHRQPLPAGKSPKASTTRASAHRFAGTPLGYDLRTHASQVASTTAPALQAPTGSGLRPATTDVMVGGLGPSAMKLAGELLEPMGMNLMQTGGGGQNPKLAGDAPAGYVDGGVINVELVRGDISLSGLGTVTHVVGDKLVAFGHPMINGGIEALPTAIGYVHWILSTQNRSFKIGEPIKSLGTLVNDRQASIVVDTKITAPVFPATLLVEGALGAPKTRWNMEISHDPFFAPSFVAVGLGSALETTTAERNDMTWRATSKIRIQGHGTIELEDFGAGDRVPIGPSDIARSRLVRALGMILNNPWEMGKIEGIDTKVKVTHARDVMFLRGTQVLDSEVDPGQPVRVRLSLLPFGGELETREIEIPLDPVLAGQEVRIRLVPGYAQERVVAPPENFADIVRMLPQLNYPGETLLAVYELPGEAIAAFEGHVADRLPPHAADLLRPDSQSKAPEVFAAQKHVVVPFKNFIVGSDTISVKVRKVVR